MGAVNKVLRKKNHRNKSPEENRSEEKKNLAESPKSFPHFFENYFPKKDFFPKRTFSHVSAY